MKTHLFPRTGVACLLSVLSLLAWRGEAQAQTVYSWNQTTSGTTTAGDWSVSSYWTPISGSGSAFPGAGDTANIYGNQTTGNTDTITYGATELGQLGTLNMMGASGLGTVVLNLDTSLTLSAGGSLYDLTGPTTSGYMDFVFNAPNAILTIGNGTTASTFTFGNAATIKSSAAQMLLGSSGDTGVGIVVANASTFDLISTLGLTEDIPIEVKSGGILNIDGEVNGGQKILLGNLTIDSGGEVTNSGADLNDPLYLTGSTYVIDGQFTANYYAASGTNPGSGVILSNQAAAGTSSTQTISFGTGSTAIDLGMRPNATGAGTVNIEKVSSSATGSASASYTTIGSNIIDSLTFWGSGVNGGTIIYQLGSNLNYGGSSSYAPFYFETTANAADTVTDEIDLNGYTYNMATYGKSFGVAWSAPNGVTMANSTSS